MAPHPFLTRSATARPSRVPVVRTIRSPGAALSSSDARADAATTSPAETA